jgi:alpha-glucosidase (family GH31 glycosyl hydrolase)
MQRDGAACWSGDINNTFATLEAQVPLGLNTGLSGIPYWGTDIGGFFHPVPKSGELYARWFQFGAFCPSFRSHGWVWREHTPWAFGMEVEAICRRYAELRYRLLPYTYTLAWQAHAHGLPLMRPLVLNYPHDPRTWELGSEYLWGDDLLVAPVTREGATSWPVYLPEGRWYDFWTQARYDGPCGVTVDAPLDRLPLFVRAGAILPLGPVMPHTEARPLDEVTLLTYPGGSAQFALYEDDGYTNAYQRGGFALTRITCALDASGRTIELGVDPPEGDASLIPPGRSYVWQVLAARPWRVTLEHGEEIPHGDGTTAAGAAWWHDGAHFLFVRTPSQASHVTVEMAAAQV